MLQPPCCHFLNEDREQQAVSCQPALPLHRAQPRLEALAAALLRAEEVAPRHACGLALRPDTYSGGPSAGMDLTRWVRPLRARLIELHRLMSLKIRQRT